MTEQAKQDRQVTLNILKAERAMIEAGKHRHKSLWNRPFSLYNFKHADHAYDKSVAALIRLEDEAELGL